MPAKRPERAEQRPITEWPGYASWNGRLSDVPEGYLWTHDEANNDRDCLIDHAALLDLTELKWYPGFTQTHAWVVGEDGSKQSYHAHDDATPEQIATSVPGSNSAVWIASTGEAVDFLAAYSAAKQPE